MDFTTPECYQDIQFLLVSSPTERCGTTLLQRVLCSGQQLIVYGENQAIMLREVASMYLYNLTRLYANKQHHDDVLQQVLSGNVNSFIADLFPDTEQYITSWTDFFYGFLLNNQKFSESIKRPLWGMKYPGFSVNEFNILNLLLQQMKVIYIYRNIFDIIKSIKARQPNYNYDYLSRTCMQWLENMQVLSTFNNDNYLYICYEDMMGAPEVYLKKIMSFSGVDDLSPDVFKHKVNAFPAQLKQAGSERQYIKPATLDKEEINVILSICREPLALHYPKLIP